MYKDTLERLEAHTIILERLRRLYENETRSVMFKFIEELEKHIIKEFKLNDT
jgi:hypothetical protein